jgi:hypothetical protein
MKRDEKDEQAMREQIAAEQSGLTKGGAPKGTNPEDLPDAPPGAPTPSVPRGAVPVDPNAPKQHPINLPAEEGQPLPPTMPTGPSTLGQPTHVQPTPRDDRGEHTPPMKRRE